MLMSALAFAEESQDRSETLYKVFCVNCHGESEQRVKIVNDGTEGMPPYSWMLSEGEAERLVKLMEEK
jgi:cytochrome c1